MPVFNGDAVLTGQEPHNIGGGAMQNRCYLMSDVLAYAIKWEDLRISYFVKRQQWQKVRDCQRLQHDLHRRLALSRSWGKRHMDSSLSDAGG